MNDKVISTLNDLVETCRDGQEGFKEASENVKRPDLKQFFNELAIERAQCAAELQQEIIKLGGHPEKTGSTAGAIHRGWMKIKGTLTGKDDHAILSECERGEDSAVQEYQDALKTDMPAILRLLVNSQFQKIRQAHNHIKQMRDAKGATTAR